MNVLAVDPGSRESAYCLIGGDRVPIRFAKVDNNVLLGHLWNPDFRIGQHVAIEMVASYGMAVGADVFETCVWIGRFYEAASVRTLAEPDLVPRLPVKLHHCGSAKAKDANITQSLVDRFAPGQPNRGKGTKAAPGWFYGFHSDIWQAYALAVYAADTVIAAPPVDAEAVLL